MTEQIVTKLPSVRLLDPETRGYGSFRVLEAFESQATPEIVEAVRIRLSRALRDFPELDDETVTVCRLRDGELDDGTQGRAMFTNRLIYLPVEQPTTNVTMYHEVAHLAIAVLDERGADVPPTSEEFCSLFAIQRMPVALIDEGRIPYLGEPEIPKERWPEVAHAALAYRHERGANSHYIQQARRWFAGEESLPEDGGESA